MFRPLVYYLAKAPGDFLHVKLEGVTPHSERIQHSRVGVDMHEQVEYKISQCTRMGQSLNPGAMWALLSEAAPTEGSTRDC